METALIQVASHYINVMQALQDERDDAFDKLSKTDTAKIEKKLRTNKRPHIQRYIPILCVCAGLSLFLSISVFSFIVKPYQR